VFVTQSNPPFPILSQAIMRWSLVLSALIAIQSALSFVCVALAIPPQSDELERRTRGQKIKPQKVRNNYAQLSYDTTHKTAGNLDEALKNHPGYSATVWGQTRKLHDTFVSEELHPRSPPSSGHSSSRKSSGTPSLEQALDFISHDELVEVSPQSIRLRKSYVKSPSKTQQKSGGRK